MPDTATRTQIARNKQSQASKAATLDLLKSKKRATTEFSIYIDNDDGQTELKMKFQALGATAYDKLIAKHPPKAEQRADGQSFNMETFAPALISACSVEPEISYDDAKEIWASEDWSRGDLMVLFRHAVDVNNRGVDIPFNEAG